MSDVIWNLGIDFSGGQNSGPGVLFYEAFEKALVTNGTATGFLMKDGLNVVTFDGTFVANNAVIQSGTITGFDVYYASSQNHLLAASGYSIDFDAFSQALLAFKASNPLLMYHLIYAPPMTVSGTEADDSSLVGFRQDTISGRGGNDTFGDLGGSDFFEGGDGDDTFIDDYLVFGGNPGNDVLFGEGGNDQLGADVPGTGGGDDFLSGGPGLDTLDGGDGSDTADYSEKADTVSVILNGPTKADVLVGGFVEDTVVNIENVNGGFANDALIGDGLINRLVGADGNDRLFGNGGNDQLFGGTGNDRIKGGADNDAIHGGDGGDKLRGGPGSDTFFFDSEPGAGNLDRLFGYSHAADTMVLDHDVFDNAGLGTLKAKFFRVGAGAEDLSDRIIYDDATGALSYDPDGTGAAAAMQFARLDAGLNITAHDFLLI